MQVTRAMARPTELTHNDVEEIKWMLKRVEQKLDMIITRLLTHEADAKRKERLKATRDWLKNIGSENALKRSHVL